MRLSGEPDSDQLRIRVDGGCVQFSVGVVLLGLGTVMLFLTWRGLAVRSFVAFLIGAAFSAAGVVVGFSASGFIIDRRQRQLTSWWSFLGFRNARQYDLGLFDRVKLVSYWNRSRIGPEQLFRILLCFRDSQLQPLEAGSELHEQRARERIAAIARFTGLPTCEEREAAENTS